MSAAVSGVDAEFLAGLAASLEQTETEANGYGRLVSAVIEAEDNGTKVTATYAEGRWTLAFSTP